MSDSDFNTPPWFLSLVRQLGMKGRIGLDPCSNDDSFVAAETAYTIEDNGLAHSWRGHGLVFMNPPHSMSPFNIEPWMEKSRAEFIDIPLDRDTTDALVGLVPAKTDTEWFHSLIPDCSGRCFLKGRPRFWQHGQETPGPGKFPSMVFYIGPAVGRFFSIFSGYGWVV